MLLCNLVRRDLLFWLFLSPISHLPSPIPHSTSSQPQPLPMPPGVMSTICKTSGGLQTRESALLSVKLLNIPGHQTKKLNAFTGDMSR